ncbi:MAG: clostripain-related cysteine peptidase [Elusimicrobiales bacterium]|nr:clostripain-related cysteine peptidase [Elusimicrobiales bacterium]
MNKLLISLTLLTLPFSYCAAEDSALDRLGAAGVSGPAPAAVPAPEPVADRSAAPAARKEWTVMVFLNAKNDLERFGMQDFNEMERVGSTDQVSVVVEMGRMAGYDASDGDWTGVRRYYVTRDSDTRRITSRVVENMGSVNMGDADELRKFVAWAKQRYPANRYALVVWNHGSGWLRGNPAPYEGKGISYDDETGNNIDTPQLRRSIADAGGVDLLASDACLMQMAEVAYEVRGAAKYMVGSEETEPGAGYDYRKVLLPLTLLPSMSTANFGRVIVAAYWDNNKIGRTVATHSILDLSKATGLAQRMHAFARTAMASPDKAAIQAARNAAQRYAIGDNKDLRHFAQLVADRATDQNLKAAARSLVSFIDDELVVLNMTSIIPRSNSGGIAAYLPTGAVSPDFAALQLSQGTQWDEFLAWQAR